MTDQTFGKNRRSILLLITAGLVLMLVSTLSYFSANPGLVSHTTTGTQAAAPSGQQMPTSAGHGRSHAAGRHGPDARNSRKTPRTLRPLSA